MTEVSFYSGVPERLDYVCRLLRKALQAGSRVLVLGPAGLLARLDAKLWAFEPTAFVPHVLLNEQTPPNVLARSPLVLATATTGLEHFGVLLNLGPELPPGFEGFARVLEVVSTDPEQVQAGRRRYKAYVSQGHTIQHMKVKA